MKRTWIILLALAMIMMMFAVACGEEKPDSSDTVESKQLDVDEDDGEVEAARGSDSSEGFNFDNVTLDDWLELSGADDASFRGTAKDTSGWVSADSN